MAEKKQASIDMKDRLIWAAILFVILGAWVGNGMWLRLSDWTKVSYIIGAGLLCALMFAMTDHSKQLYSFIKESRIELKKVIWPGKQEAVRVTGIVILVVIVVSILLSIIDRLLFALIAMLTQM